MIQDFINQISLIRETQDFKAALLLCEKIAYCEIEAGKKWDYEGNPAKSENLEMCWALKRLGSTLDVVIKQIASTVPTPVNVNSQP